jgi:hypothetical protein
MKNKLNYFIVLNVILCIFLSIWDFIISISIGVTLKYEVDESSSEKVLMNISDRKAELNEMIFFFHLNSCFLIISSILLILLYRQKKNL